MNTRYTILISTFMAFFLPGALFANEIRLRAGFWPGALQPELENRFLLDDFVVGTSAGRYNLPWENKTTYTVHPLSLEFLVGLGPGDLFFGGAYTYYGPDYEYTGLGINTTSISSVRLSDYSVSDSEGYVGYEYPVLADRLDLRAFIGYRSHSKEFLYQELTVGSGTVVINGESPFSASTGGNWMGLGARLKVVDQIYLKANYMWSPSFFPGWEGTMEYERTVYGVSSGSVAFSFERATAGYVVSIQNFQGSVEYELSDEISLEAGYANERLNQRYPDYFGLPIIGTLDSGGQIVQNSIAEIITDSLIYDRVETQEKSAFFFAATLSYDFGG